MFKTAAGFISKIFYFLFGEFISVMVHLRYDCLSIYQPLYGSFTFLFLNVTVQRLSQL